MGRVAGGCRLRLGGLLMHLCPAGFLHPTWWRAPSKLYSLSMLHAASDATGGKGLDATGAVMLRPGQ